MAENIEIKRKIFGKVSFSNVVDTEFKQLVPKDGTASTTLTTDVSKFFKDYDNLFFDIPTSGSVNSHEELVKRSSEYLGVMIDALQEEILNLREENTSLKNQLYIISQNI